MSVAAAGTGLSFSRDYRPELESLRGWAILLIALFHYFGLTTGKTGVDEQAPFVLKLIAAGNTGVTLFFVLSGFLLARPFIQDLQSQRSISVWRFYIARILRIVPLYYAVVFIAWAVTRKTEAFQALLFIPLGFQVFPYSVPWWSLCTEVQFYLVLPWAMLMLRHVWGRAALVMVLLLWLSAHLYYLHRPGWSSPLNLWESSLFGRGGAFVLGGLFAWFYLSPVFGRLIRSTWLVNGVFLLSLGALLWLLAWYGETGQRKALELLPMYHNYEALLWGVLMLGILSPVICLRALFINRLMEHFGRVSYSFYLVHLPIQFYWIHSLKEATGQVIDYARPVTLLILAASFLSSWLLAVMTYRAIERPFLRLKPYVPLFMERRTSTLETALDK